MLLICKIIYNKKKFHAKKLPRSSDCQAWILSWSVFEWIARSRSAMFSFVLGHLGFRFARTSVARVSASVFSSFLWPKSAKFWGLRSLTGCISCFGVWLRVFRPRFVIFSSLACVFRCWFRCHLLATFFMFTFSFAQKFVPNSGKFQVVGHIFSFLQSKVGDWAAQQSKLASWKSSAVNSQIMIAEQHNHRLSTGGNWKCGLQRGKSPNLAQTFVRNWIRT